MTDDFCRCPGCGSCGASAALDKARAYLKDEIAKINADDRLKGPDASVFSNGYLAVIQIELKTRRRALQDALRKLGS